MPEERKKGDFRGYATLSLDDEKARKKKGGGKKKERRIGCRPKGEPKHANSPALIGGS